jgi:recombinational DNA repair protein RecR
LEYKIGDRILLKNNISAFIVEVYSHLIIYEYKIENEYGGRYWIIESYITGLDKSYYRDIKLDKLI